MHTSLNRRASTYCRTVFCRTALFRLSITIVMLLAASLCNQNRVHAAGANSQASPNRQFDISQSGGERTSLDPIRLEKSDFPRRSIASNTYSFAHFTDHVSAARWELALIGGTIVAIGLKDWGWGGSRFRFINEGWFGRNTRHGGMDKIGHAFSTHVIADLLTHRIRDNASNPAGAAITAALLAFGIMGMVEVVDGFTGKHRFSREDIIANAAGAAFSAIRNTVPGLHDKLDFRLMYTPASFERPGLSEAKFSFTPPYYRQRYIFALKASGFDMFRNTPMRYLELHAGFEARGFSQKEKALRYPIERRLYVGVGLNLNEVLFGKSAYPNFSKYENTLAGTVAKRTLEYVQFPYTAIYYRSRPAGLRP